MYCNTWKLTVNCTKTKVLIFGGSRKDCKAIYKLGNMKLDTVEIYKYLGISFQISLPILETFSFHNAKTLCISF